MWLLVEQLALIIIKVCFCDDLTRCSFIVGCIYGIIIGSKSLYCNYWWVADGFFDYNSPNLNGFGRNSEYK